MMQRLASAARLSSVPTTNHRVAMASVAVALFAAAAGCGGDKPAYCQDRNDLKSSIDDLKNVDVRSDGVSAARAQLKTVKASATTLVGSAKKEFEPQATALKGAVATLETVVAQATSAPSSQSVATVVAGITGVQAAFQSLSKAVSDTC
jgi:hypothetical protein